MTSPNAPFALRGLGSVLSADLDRSTVREWLGEKQRAALERPSAALGSALETVDGSCAAETSRRARATS